MRIAQLLSKSMMVVEGSARIKLGLGLTQQFFLLSRSATVPVHFRQEVAVDVPGNQTTREKAAALLKLGTPVFDRLNSGLEAARNFMSKWRNDLWSTYAQSLLHVEASYVVKNRTGNQLPMKFACNGFRISKSGFVLPYEALEPWSFDSQIAASIQEKQIFVVKGSYDLEVLAAPPDMGPSNSVSTSLLVFGANVKPESIPLYSTSVPKQSADNISISGAGLLV